jgi:transcriptional regulator GlxA family with amidase domain
MQVNVEQPLSTADVAARIGISRRQLERLFQLHRHCTPSEYYMKIRLEHARVLLLETGLSLLNVALASGFVSQSHFGACYREHFGHTPGDERRGAGDTMHSAE